jgi:hypothetical protein
MSNACAAVIQAMSATVMILTIQIKIDVNFIKFMLMTKQGLSVWSEHGEFIDEISARGVVGAAISCRRA